jgi:hypothetical protein
MLDAETYDTNKTHTVRDSQQLQEVLRARHQEEEVFEPIHSMDAFEVLPNDMLQAVSGIFLVP